MNLQSYYKNKVVLVTGSTLGIGKELANLLLSLGAKVIITGRDSKKLEALKTEFAHWNDNILYHQGDVTDQASNLILIEKIIQRFGKLDVLINNAALSGFGTVDKMQAEVAKQIIDANIYGSLFPVIAALPELKKSKGNILFVSSISGYFGIPEYSAYTLSKMSLTALTQSLSIELSTSNVSVGIAYVGLTKNESVKKILTPQGELVFVPERPKNLTVSRTHTATKILKQIKNKKMSSTHSAVGVFTKIMSRYFPSITYSVLKMNYNKKSKK